MCLIRLFNATSNEETVFGLFILLLFGTISVFLIFDIRIENFGKKIHLDYAFILIGMIIVESMILLYDTDNLFLYILKIFLSFVFFIGAIIIFTQLFKQNNR
jgi:hypothetical protein